MLYRVVLEPADLEHDPCKPPTCSSKMIKNSSYQKRLDGRAHSELEEEFLVSHLCHPVDSFQFIIVQPHERIIN